MNTYKLKIGAFTMIELIVVTAILSILGVISFISYNSYSGTGRDGARVTDVVNITSGLNLYMTKGGLYPMPEGTISTGTINGKEVVYKGEIRDNIARLANLSKTPIDPLTKGYYVYGTSFNNKYFQVGTTLENTQNISYKLDLSLEEVYADATTNYSTKVDGKYLGLIKFNTGSSVYLANIPSLIFNFSGSNVYSGNLLISSGVYFVIDKNINYPYALNGSMNINNKDGNTILQSITNNSGATLTGVDITSITNSTGTVSSLFSGSVLSSFGYSIDVITSAVGVSNVNSNIVVTNTNCSSTTYSGYTISALNNGVSQTFTKTISNGTGSILATCNNAVLSYGTESIVCSSGYEVSGSSCVVTYDVLLTHFDGNSTNYGTNLSTITNGSVTFNSAGKFSNSAYTNGSNYISIADSSDWCFGNGNFTIDFWTNFNTVGNNMLIAQGADGNNDWYFGLRAGELTFYHADGGAWRAYYGYSWAPITGTWYHVALVRDGTNFYLFIDGQLKTWTHARGPIGTNTFADFSAPLIVGYSPYANSYHNGYIDELRISKGIARRTSTFTPPSSPY